MHRFVISEYGFLVKDKGVSVSGSNCHVIPDHDFNYLNSLLFSSTPEKEDSFFIKPANYMGHQALQVQNFVGVLQTPFHSQIEILPKIFNHEGKSFGRNKVRSILVRMLSFLRNSPFRQSGKAMLFDVDIPLIELFLSYYLEELNKLVKKGIRSDYIRSRENLPFMRGKLLVAQQIRHNIVHQHRFFVEYDEFRLNRPENRLIKSSLELISSFIRHSRSQRLCNEMLFAFDSVPPSCDYRSDFRRCSDDRSMAYYQHVLDWCRLILTNQSPLASSGSTKSISLLFPMEKIFEDYVAARLNQLFPGWQIRTQARQHYLARQGEKRCFLLKPDIVLEKGAVRIVADTKWKILSQNPAENFNYSISQADLYQMYAYGNKYLNGQSKKEVYLIYPLADSFSSPLDPFYFEDDFKLFIVPFDLDPQVDKMILGENNSYLVDN
ncbi:MAG: McrC family protein [Desulfobulbaceae bacterium]